MAAIKSLNAKAEVARSTQALAINISAARGLQDVLRTNLGPKGTMKMLVSGAGDIKLTKDGNVLLHEMQIQHPTASLIAKVATAQDDITGDGTTSNVLIIGELLKQADNYVQEGVHPRIITEGFELAKDKALEVLESIKCDVKITRDRLIDVAKTSLVTKVHRKLADQLTEIVVDAVLSVKREDEPINLHMVEIMEMQHKLDCDTSEVNAGFFYKSASEREKLVEAERRFTNDKVNKVIQLKKEVCDASGDNEMGFVLINQKGIDPLSLDMLAKNGIVALRRAKRRNMERLVLACGGTAMNSVDELSVDCLGKAGLVYEHVLGEAKFTFVEKCNNPHSVTILIKGPNKHTITQIKDAVRDGLRAVKNAIEDDCVVPGAGGFQIAAYDALMRFKPEVKGRAQLGVQAFADALLVIPKVLAQNAGLDPQETIVKLQQEYAGSNLPVGIDLQSGEPMNPVDAGVLDNHCVTKQLLNSCTVIASNLLLVDEMMRAGMATLKG
uniref:T-complex protein 1 subunit zeta n=1 Tax=Ciona intestinalis TaxID=7719 RepID=F6Q0U4_CIOIN